MALKTSKIREFPVAIAVSLFAAIVFYFSTKAILHDLDYTSQIASALLHGQLGLREKPPDWLNEMIPQGDRYYSAFPLGAVISMLPVALLRNTGLIQNFPGHILASLIAGLCVYFHLLQERSSPWLLEIEPSYSSHCLFTSICSGASQTKEFLPGRI